MIPYTTAPGDISSEAYWLLHGFVQPKIIFQVDEKILKKFWY